MRDARWLRFAIRLVSSGIESQELEREEIRVHANIDVNRPYKPRKLKQDQYHKMMREAHERKPQDTAKEAKELIEAGNLMSNQKPEVCSPAKENAGSRLNRNPA